MQGDLLTGVNLADAMFFRVVAHDLYLSSTFLYPFKCRGEILKSLLLALYNTATTLFSYLRHLYDPTWMHSIR